MAARGGRAHRARGLGWRLSRPNNRERGGRAAEHRADRDRRPARRHARVHGGGPEPARRPRGDLRQQPHLRGDLLPFPRLASDRALRTFDRRLQDQRALAPRAQLRKLRRLRRPANPARLAQPGRLPHRAVREVPEPLRRPLQQPDPHLHPARLGPLLRLRLERQTVARSGLLRLHAERERAASFLRRRSRGLLDRRPRRPG